jgi:hypothetical protein
MKKKTKLVLIAVLAAALVVVAGGFAYYRYKHTSLTTKSGVPSSSTVSKTDAELENGQGRAVDPATSPNQPNPNTVKNSAGVPTPSLTKSAGNVAPAPRGVLIDFVCTVPQDDYQCQLELIPKSGQNKPNFAKLSMKPDRSGLYGAVWNWQTESGKWEVDAVLYNSSGDTARSPIQSFEVQ